MRQVVVLMAVVVMLVLQATVAPRIAAWRVPPELVVILVVQLAFRLPGIEALLWPWGVGLAVEVRGEGPIGVLAFAYALAAILIQRAVRPFFGEGFGVRLAAVAVVVLLHHVALGISQLVRGQAPSLMLFAKTTLVGAGYTTALAAPVLPALDAALRRVLPRTRPSR